MPECNAASHMLLTYHFCLQDAPLCNTASAKAKRCSLYRHAQILAAMHQEQVWCICETRRECRSAMQLHTCSWHIIHACKMPLCAGVHQQKPSTARSIGMRRNWLPCIESKWGAFQRPGMDARAQRRHTHALGISFLPASCPSVQYSICKSQALPAL